MAEALSAHSPIIEKWEDERNLAISAPKSTITLFTPQFAHPRVTLNNSILPLEKTPCILDPEGEAIHYNFLLPGEGVTL